MFEADLLPALSTLVLITDEIAVLAAIGEAHPGKAAKLAEICRQWEHLAKRIRTRMN